jgi:hypothetical protein
LQQVRVETFGRRVFSGWRYCGFIRIALGGFRSALLLVLRALLILDCKSIMRKVHRAHGQQGCKSQALRSAGGFGSFEAKGSFQCPQIRNHPSRANAKWSAHLMLKMFSSHRLFSMAQCSKAGGFTVPDASEPPKGPAPHHESRRCASNTIICCSSQPFQPATPSTMSRAIQSPPSILMLRTSRRSCSYSCTKT